MSIHVEHKDDGARVGLLGELTIYSVTKIKTALAVAMNDIQGVAIEIDLSAVTEIDSAGLQLLLIVKSNPDKDIRFTNPTPSVQQLIDLANLSRALSESSAISTVQTEDVRHEQ